MNNDSNNSNKVMMVLIVMIVILMTTMSVRLVQEKLSLHNCRFVIEACIVQQP